MSSITPTSTISEFIDTSSESNKVDSEAPNLADYFIGKTGEDFQYTFDNAVPLNQLSQDDLGGLHSNLGIVNPDEQSPLNVVTEGLGSILSFSETLSKRLSALSINAMTRESEAIDAVVDIIVNVIGGVVSLLPGAAISFNLSSLLGTILSAVGLGAIAELLGLVSSVAENISKAKTNQKEFEKEQGKWMTATLKANNEAISNTSGLNIQTANVQQFNNEVLNISANVGVNIDSASYTLASQTILENSRFKTQVADLFKGSYTHWEIKSDSSITMTSSVCNRYFSVGLRETAAEVDYVSSFHTNYADFRWTQTGQYSLPLTVNLADLVGDLFDLGSNPILQGTHVNVATFNQLNIAQLGVNANYGNIYTIDAIFTFINCGIGAGLAAIPLKSYSSIKDPSGSDRTKAQKPEPVVKINNRTTEPVTQSPYKIEHMNDIGKLVTRITDDLTPRAKQVDTPTG